MSDQQDVIQKLIEDVRYLKDRQEILDCIYAYSRGVDRHDEEVLLSVYHSDAIDEHGSAVNSMPDFAKYIEEITVASTIAHSHNIANHFCEIDGDVAHAESYLLGGLALKDSNDVWFSGGRYVDRLERRDGVWKIALRRCIMDWSFIADGSVAKTEWYKGMGYAEGKWDKTDLSYMRPLKPSDQNA